jgi:L-erythro-3,5-diaminohexanoate dehydrogenase
MEIMPNEILIDVETLNIDSASFTQIRQEAGDDEAQIAQIMLDIVDRRGKHHNPVTGSGGMFIGIVKAIGRDLEAKRDLQVGSRIASLVSLTLPHRWILRDRLFSLRAAFMQYCLTTFPRS